MSFTGTFYEASKRYLVSIDLDAVEVTNVDQATESGGYCDTCWYEYAVIEISYKDSSGKLRSHTYSGDLGEFIRELDDVMGE